jgi:hypothetical protein
MGFSISPGVVVSEIDLTTVIPSVSTTTGAFCGAFTWGPTNKKTQITTESNLSLTFGRPDSNTFTSYYTAASFLAYASDLRVVRALGLNAKNAVANTIGTTVIANEDIYDVSYRLSDNGNLFGAFAARYPGALGNSLTISVIDAGSAATYNTWSVGGVNVSGYFNGAPGTSTQANSRINKRPNAYHCC